MIPHFLPLIAEDDIQAVADTLRAGHLSDGVETSMLEKDVSAYLCDCHAVGVASGTAGLYLALKALDIGQNDKVAIPSYTCNGLFAAVVLAGATPVCADSCSEGPSITASSVQAVMDDDVKCVIAPHALGFLADIDEIRELGKPVIEDFSQAFGGFHSDGMKVGMKGDIAVASLYATKLVAAGEGGICLTRNPDLASTMKTLRNCDEMEPDPRAFNFKMSDICAALARSKLADISTELAARAMMSKHYARALDMWSLQSGSSQIQTVCFRYLVTAGTDVQETIDAASRAGIECRRPVYRPLHRSLGGDCPFADRLFERVMSVPFHRQLTDRQMDHVCQTVRQLLEASPPCLPQHSRGEATDQDTWS